MNGSRTLVPLVLTIALGGALVALAVADSVLPLAWRIATGVVCVFALGGVAVWQAKLSHRFENRSQSAEMVRAAYDGALASHMITDSHGDIIYANSVAEKLLGFGVGDSIDALAPQFKDEESTEVFARLRAAAAHGRTYRGEVVADDGALQRTYDLRIRPLPQHGDTTHWRIEDVTERREVEAVMRAEQSKLTDFMDRAPVGFYSIDEDGRFHFANATLVRWLGVDA
ncbi:MAG: PAS domain-containing protein, partial [Pseudomonadota bacterium]